MWNSFWVEQLFGSSVRQLADGEGVGAEGGQCGVSWVRAAPRYFNIWFKQRAQSFPSAFFVCLASLSTTTATTAAAAATRLQQRQLHLLYIVGVCLSWPPPRAIADNANDNSAVRALSASAFNFQRQSARGVGRGRGEWQRDRAVHWRSWTCNCPGNYATDRRQI